MARFISAGPTAGLAVMNPNAFIASNEDFFRMRVNQAYDVNTELGRQMMQQALQRTEAVNGFAAIQAGRAAANQIRAMSGMDCIKPLWTVEDFQAAPQQMVNWIMTDPTLRALYHRGSIEGWSDIYVDPNPHETGEESMAYMLLNNGVFIPDEAAGWKYHNYNIDYGDVEPLHILDVEAIKTAQVRLIEMLSQAGDGDQDPTSQYGASL